MIENIYVAAALSAAAVLAAAGVVQLAGPAFVRRAYERWGMPRKFYRVTGMIEIVAAAFLATAQTRIWGAVLGAIISFAAVVTLLKSEQYAWSIPGIVLLLALMVAPLATPF